MSITIRSLGKINYFGWNGAYNGPTAPPNKSVPLARGERDFSRFCIRLLVYHPPTMRPRTILGTINGNRGVGNELTPNRRGKIKGAIAVGANSTQAAKLVNYIPRGARKTISLAPERHNGILKPRSRRPQE